MENVKKHFAEKRNDLYARIHLAKTQEEGKKVIRGTCRGSTWRPENTGE